jgi:RIO kinase 1
MIDTPQVVDVFANPRGAEFLERDAANVSRWFASRGLTADMCGADPCPADLPAVVREEARR